MMAILGNEKVDFKTIYLRGQFIFFNVYLFLKERETAQEGEGQRQRETQNLKQDPGSKLSAQSPTGDSNSQTAKS